MENTVKIVVSPTLSYKIKFTYSQKSSELSYIAAKKRECPMKMVLLAIGLVALSVVLLGVKVLFVKGGSFPSGHVHDLPQLKRKKQKRNNHQSQ